MAALRCYIRRTADVRPVDTKPVFITLTRKCHAIQASILQEAIVLAGLEGQGFTAKCFRPTGATTGVKAGCDSNIVRTVGRWKSQEVFEEHYVHTVAPSNFTDKLLC